MLMRQLMWGSLDSLRIRAGHQKDQLFGQRVRIWGQPNLRERRELKM